MRRALLFRVLDAVEAPGFPEELRHMCIRYAYAANAKTGAAWYGQTHMAAVLGISERQLRRRLVLLDELASQGRSPIRIERHRRGAPGGVGRSSDEWRIIVLTDKPKRTPASGSDGSPSGHARPVEPEAEADIHDTRSGHPRQAEPDTHVLGSSVVIQRSDPAEDLRHGKTAPTPEPLKLTEAKPTNSKRKKKSNAPDGYQDVVACYVEAYESARGKRPIFGSVQGRKVKDLLQKLPALEACEVIRRCYADPWWRTKATIADIAKDPDRWRGNTTSPANGGNTPKQPNAGTWRPNVAAE